MSKLRAGNAWATLHPADQMCVRHMAAVRLRLVCAPGKPGAEGQGDVTAAAAGSGGTAFQGPGWDAVGGNAAAMRQLREMVVLPLLYPEVLSHMGIRAPRWASRQRSPAVKHESSLRHPKVTCPSRRVCNLLSVVAAKA